MPTLTLLDSTHGFTAGDLDCSGQIAVCSAYQRVYFADGRPYNSDIHLSGYHKLDFIDDKLVGQISAGAFTNGYTLVQSHSFIGTGGNNFNAGDTVTQVSSGAKGIVAAVTSTTIDILPTDGTFDASNNLESASYTFTVTNGVLGGAEGVFSETVGSGASAEHYVYRTTTTPFNLTNIIYEANSDKTLLPASVAYPPHWLNWTLRPVTYAFQSTADSGDSTTLVDASLEGTYVTDDEITGWYCYILSGVGKGSYAKITSYTASGGHIHVADWLDENGDAGGVNPAKNSGYGIRETESENTGGEFPDGGSDILALAFGRIFMNSKFHPHQWFATRINDPLDLALVTDDVASACNSQTSSQAGLVGDQIVAIIPNKDLFVIFGCVNKMFLLRSDPLRNGFFTVLTDHTGIFSSTSYCWDDKYNLYFIGNDGIYILTYESLLDGLPAENLTKDRAPKLLTDMGLNRGTDRVTMAYDKDRYGIQITASQKDGAWHTALWLDLRTGGIFPEKYTTGQIPASSFYFDSRIASERTCLIGGYDGYIRRYDEATKSDIASDDSSVAIDSYVTIGPVAAQNIRGKIKLNELSVRTGIDTDRLSIGLYSAVTAAKLIDDIKAGVSPKTFKTFTLDSLLPSLRQKLLDGAVAVVISNNTVDSSFSIEKIDADISETGRVK